MRTNVTRLCASLLLVLFVAPQVLAQDDDGMADAAEKAEGHHVHHGTMTPPGQEPMDIKYEISMADGGHAGWIVANANGEEARIEMKDLEMSHEMVSYYWSPPGSDLIITCELGAAEEGGWAGECTDNEDGGIGMMSIKPMSMDHDEDHAEDHDDGDDHEHADADDDHGDDDYGDEDDDEEDD